MAMRAILTPSIPSRAIRRTAADRMRSRAPARGPRSRCLGEIPSDPIGEPRDAELACGQRSAPISAGVNARLDGTDEVDILVGDDLVDVLVEEWTARVRGVTPGER